MLAKNYIYEGLRWIALVVAIVSLAVMFGGNALSDADFEDFVSFAKTQDFDYRSSAKATFDKMKEELEKDGLAEVMSGELSALEKALEMDKERFIRLKKDEIIPFIEEEIVTRYHFQEAGIKIRLRYDKQLKEALKK